MGDAGSSCAARRSAFSSRSPSALGVGLLAPIEDRVTRVLAGWNAGGWLYFALVATKMWHAEIEGIKREAGIERESRIAVLVIVILGSLFAMLALFTQLSVMKSEHGFDRSLSISPVGVDDFSVLVVDALGLRRVLRP